MPSRSDPSRRAGTRAKLRFAHPKGVPEGKRPKRALRAVVSEIEDGFVVSISTVSDENEIQLVAEETVESLGLAEAMIGQTAMEFKHKMNDVDLIYNLSDVIFTKLPESRLSH